MKAFLVIAVLYTYMQGATPTNREASVAYFRKMAAVMQHPRCLNCHPKSDQPTQGMDMHTHLMNV